MCVQLHTYRPTQLASTITQPTLVPLPLFHQNNFISASHLFVCLFACLALCLVCLFVCLRLAPCISLPQFYHHIFITFSSLSLFCRVHRPSAYVLVCLFVCLMLVTFFTYVIENSFGLFLNLCVIIDVHNFVVWFIINL